jgi:hypothetical protein
MRLTTRLERVEARLRPDDKEPRLVSVLDDEDGTWRDGRGNAVDPASIGPWVKVIRLVNRADWTP